MIRALGGQDALDRLFDPSAYQGAAQTFIDRLLAAANKDQGAK